MDLTIFCSFLPVGPIVPTPTPITNLTQAPQRAPTPVPMTPGKSPINPSKTSLCPIQLSINNPSKLSLRLVQPPTKPNINDDNDNDNSYDDNNEGDDNISNNDDHYYNKDDGDEYYYDY